MGPQPFPERGCKQIPEEIAWLRSLRACCNWPGLKEHCKLYAGQGNANASLKQACGVDEKSWVHL